MAHRAITCFAAAAASVIASERCRFISFFATAFLSCEVRLRVGRAPWAEH